MSYWFAQMDDRADQKYPEQIAFLREEHGFSQAHANALVMYCRGSKTTRRFDTVDEYLAPFDETTQTTVWAIFKAITAKYPKLELVIAWNKPMLRLDGQYIFGVAVLTNYILLAPCSSEVMEEFAPRLKNLKANKKTIQVPLDWKPNATLLRDLVAARIAETKR